MFRLSEEEQRGLLWQFARAKGRGGRLAARGPEEMHEQTYNGNCPPRRRTRQNHMSANVKCKQRHRYQRKIVFSALAAATISCRMTEARRRDEPPKDWAPYYQQLARECQKRGSPNCCMASVGAMVKGNYQLTPASGCPDGYVGNMMRCIDSYRWCEPTGKRDPESVLKVFREPVVLQRADGYDDGGTRVIELIDASNQTLTFCLDGRLRAWNSWPSPPPKSAPQLFFGPHPSSP